MKRRSFFGGILAAIAYPFMNKVTANENSVTVKMTNNVGVKFKTDEVRELTGKFIANPDFTDSQRVEIRKMICDVLTEYHINYPVGPEKLVLNFVDLENQKTRNP